MLKQNQGGHPTVEYDDSVMAFEFLLIMENLALF